MAGENTVSAYGEDGGLLNRGSIWNSASVVDIVCHCAHRFNCLYVWLLKSS